MRNLLILLLAFALPAWAGTISGKVVGIADGDTITVLDARNHQHKIRLMGVDAPEKKQPYGQRSKQHLSNLIFDKAVTLDCKKKDRYGREVCVVYLDGKDVNLEQVEAGMAWWYRQYAKEQTAEQREAYAAAERDARSKKLGLWADGDATPPWDFRHQVK